jgi:hypothetical protein
LTRARWLSGVFAASGALAIAGALLPWLTLYAGLYAYSGVGGLYGRLVAAGGAAALVAGVLALRAEQRRLAWLGVVLGVALIGFAAWLLAGMQDVLRRPEAVMAVAQPGPGLVVVLVSGGLMVISSAAIIREMVVFDDERPGIGRYANRSAVRVIERHDRS